MRCQKNIQRMKLIRVLVGDHQTMTVRCRFILNEFSGVSVSLRIWYTNHFLSLLKVLANLASSASSTSWFGADQVREHNVMLSSWLCGFGALGPGRWTPPDEVFCTAATGSGEALIDVTAMKHGVLHSCSFFGLGRRSGFGVHRGRSISWGDRLCNGGIGVASKLGAWRTVHDLC